MKYIALSMFFAASSAAILGFNIGQTKHDGGCKNVEDYVADFLAVDKEYRTFKTFSIFDPCHNNILPLVLEAANRTNSKIVVGLWATDSVYDQEKTALATALGGFGVGKLVSGIVVASECLYRSQYEETGEMKPEILAARITEIKKVVKSSPSRAISGIPVATADTWNVLVDLQNISVLKAVDMIYVNCFPYWQGYHIDDAYDGLYAAIKAVQDTLRSVNVGAKVAIGETGWPSQGRTYGFSVPGIENAEKFWRRAFCQLRAQQNIDAFWFEAFDEKKPDRHNVGTESHWGAYDSFRGPKFNTSC